MHSPFCQKSSTFARGKNGNASTECLSCLLLRNKVKALHYGKDIESALIRYARALDSQDYQASFIKLWGVLELLTSTLGDSYDKTIKRTLFHFKDREYSKQVLEHLRQYRNKSVHSEAGESDIDTFIYQLKYYVERLLWFHISSDFNFKDLPETGKFMELPTDISKLKEQITFYKSGIKYYGG